MEADRDNSVETREMGQFPDFGGHRARRLVFCGMLRGELVWAYVQELRAFLKNSVRLSNQSLKGERFDPVFLKERSKASKVRRVDAHVEVVDVRHGSRVFGQEISSIEFFGVFQMEGRNSFVSLLQPFFDTLAEGLLLDSPGVLGPPVRIGSGHWLSEDYEKFGFGTVCLDAFGDPGAVKVAGTAITTELFGPSLFHEVLQIGESLLERGSARTAPW